jgi:hypothetical protein
MAIVGGTKIEAIDFTSIVGTNATNQAFPDENSSVNKLNALFGVGWGSRGMGQVPFVYTAVGDGTTQTFDINTVVDQSLLLATVNLQSVVIEQVVGSNVVLASIPPLGSQIAIYAHAPGAVLNTPVLSSHWQFTRNAVYKLNQFLAITDPSLPSASNYDQGNTISALNYNWLQAVINIDQSRDQIPLANLITTPLFTNTRTSSWFGFVQLEFDVNFSSEDHARWFFNAGGAINITPSFVPLGSDQRSASWRTLLDGTNPSNTNFAGGCSIQANQTVRTNGQGGTFNTSGWYQLTRSISNLIQDFRCSQLNLPIYNDYSNNQYTVSVIPSNGSGQNGGNGRTLKIQITFTDTTGTQQQPVQGTLSVDVSLRYSNPVLMMISNPTVQIATNLSQGGGTGQGGNTQTYAFTDNITSTTLNYNLLAQAVARGYTGAYSTLPLQAVVNIAEGIIVGSSTLSAAFTVPNLVSGSTVVINNQGYILGKGGDGGVGTRDSAAGAGTPGGLALLLQHNTRINNLGIIGGGGGGGGGGTATSGGPPWENWGGSGGGGAGWQPGLAGAPAQTANVPASDGGLELGGLAGQPIREINFNGIDSATIIWQAGLGGNGGNLGSNGVSGQNGWYDSGGYVAGAGGTAGAAINGQSYIQTGSNLGDIRGAQT